MWCSRWEAKKKKKNRFTLKKREMLFNKYYGPHVLLERYKGAWPRSTPVLVLAVDVLFKTSKAHQGWLSVFLEECQAFRRSPSGEHSPFILFGHLSHLHVNKCGGLGSVCLCTWWMCWCVMRPNKVQLSHHSPISSLIISHHWGGLHVWFTGTTAVEVWKLCWSRVENNNREDGRYAKISTASNSQNVLSLSRFQLYGSKNISLFWQEGWTGHL